MSFEIVNPKSLGEPKGWNHGMLAPPGGRLLFIAGQAGWESDTAGDPPGFVEQFGRALDKVVAVVREAGGGPEDIGRMIIYVTDLAAYQTNRKALGEAWRARLGRHYPAVALLEVKGLADEGAVVEIEATAVLGAGGGGTR